MPQDSKARQIAIAADVDLARARTLHAELCATVASVRNGDAVLLEIASARATAPALQLLQATRQALSVRGAQVSLGPHAADLLPRPRTAQRLNLSMN